MNQHKKKHLENKCWKIGDATEFLYLSPDETAYEELKLLPSKNLQDKGLEKKLTQEQFARMIKSSQSRDVEMESGDPSVSLDLLIQSLLTLGALRKTISRMMI